MFSIREQRYPKGWKDMSYDFKLFFAFHICMMILLITGNAIGVVIKLAITVLLAGILLFLSLAHRKKSQWHWPGVTARNVINAIVTIIFGGIFLYAGYPLFSPANPRLLPFYLAALGIIFFNTLFFLKIVCMAEAEFLRSCGGINIGSKEEVYKSFEPSWKKTVRICYSILFVIIWLEFMLFFHKFSVAFHNGSPEPTVTQTEKLVNHGKVSYVTPEEKRVIDTLEAFMWIGFPTVFLLGAFLHFVVGVKLVPNVKTIKEKMSGETVQTDKTK